VGRGEMGHQGGGLEWHEGIWRELGKDEEMKQWAEELEVRKFTNNLRENLKYSGNFKIFESIWHYSNKQKRKTFIFTQI
jgi:hypothetical protein